MAITKATKLIVGLLATGSVSGGVAGSYYLLKPKATKNSSKAPSDSDQNSDLSDVAARDSNPSSQALNSPKTVQTGSADVQSPPLQPSEDNRGVTSPEGS